MLLALVREVDLLSITADHVNDPTTPAAHACECVSLLVRVPHAAPKLGGRTRGFYGLEGTAGDSSSIVFRRRRTSFLPSALGG